MSRRPLSLPISLGVVMLVLLVLIITLWVLMSVFSPEGVTYWTFMVLGLVFLVMVVVGVVIYLTLSVKAINLNRRQSNFIDSVTHELKSPIASLKLYLQTLSRRPVSPEEQAEFYKFMLEDVERLDLLINHILSAARLEKDTTTDVVQRIELDRLLVDCARGVCKRYRIDQADIRMNLAPCCVVCSELDLSLIFGNLIDNAVKYADASQPEVSITSSYDAGRCQTVVRICDNGQGIPRPLRRKVFGRFVRLGTELERKKPGTGLGLFIVRTLVKRWKGEIQITSRDESGGTVFQVTLPNATALPAKHPTPTEPSTAQPTNGAPAAAGEPTTRETASNTASQPDDSTSNAKSADGAA